MKAIMHFRGFFKKIRVGVSLKKKARDLKF